MPVDRGTVHVFPLDDLIDHDTTTEEDCICGPTTEAVEREDGTIGWVILHHSLDGREASEGTGTEWKRQ